MTMTYAALKSIIEAMTPEQQQKEVLIATEFAMIGDITAGRGINVEDAKYTIFGEDETDIDSDHPVIVATTEGL